MIFFEDGRARVQRTGHEEDTYFQAVVDGLDADEVEALKAILEELGEGDDDLLGLMVDAQWAEEPVSMEQFLDDDYYLGIAAQTLYPRLREELIRLFDDGRYSEVILAGSIGWGKTTAASFIACRVLYEMLCLREPQRAYGLSPGSEVHFTLLSKNLHLARRVLMSATMEKIKLSPWFTDQIVKSGDEEVHFRHNIVLQIGSVNSERVLGLNVFANMMDEVNFMTSGGRQVIKAAVGQKAGIANYDRAEKVYATIDRRIKSRFMNGGRIPGMNVLISSKTTKNSFTERRIRSARMDPSVYVMDFATWDVKPSKLFSGKNFKVLVGSQTARSRILEPDEDKTLDQTWLQESGAFLIDVPEEYRKDFEIDLNMAIRDVAGVSTEAIHAYIARQEAIFEAVQEDLHHPFSTEEWTYGEPGQFMWGKICDQYERRLRGGHKEIAWKPKRHPKALRHVHLDIAISGDSLGLAMGHIVRWVEVLRKTPEGQQYSDLAPEFELDLMLRVNPPKGEHIYLPDIRALVYDLMEHGFIVSSFSCDQFQSTEMLQNMKAKGVSSEVISVDRTTAPYEKLKQALYEGRLRTYEYQPFIDEALSLEYDTLKGKVDHPLAGSKDVTDAVAGVLEGLVKHASAHPIPFSVGAGTGEADDPDQDGTWVLSGDMKPVPEKKGKGPSPTKPNMPFLMG